MITADGAVKWTDVVTALSSVSSTVVATAAAVVGYLAGRAAWRSYKVQQKQLERAEEDRVSELASKFGIWIEHEENVKQNQVFFHNGGSQPVYKVYILYDLEDPYHDYYDDIRWAKNLSPGPRTGLSGDYEAGDLGPTKEPILMSALTEHIREGIKMWEYDSEERRIEGLFPVDPEDGYRMIELTVTFTDAKGLRWERKKGALRPAPLNPEN